MVRVKKFGPTALYLMARTRRARSTAKVITFGVITHRLKATGKTTIFTARERTSGQMEGSTKDSGRTTICMVKEFTLGLMAASTRASGPRGSSTGRAGFASKTALRDSRTGMGGSGLRGWTSKKVRTASRWASRWCCDPLDERALPLGLDGDSGARFLAPAVFLSVVASFWPLGTV